MSAPRALLWLALLSGTVSLACGPTERHVGLADLAFHQDTYRGQLVTTEGTVRAFHDSGSDYFVIEDPAQDRVALLPASRAAPYAGERVRVAGTFDVTPGIGRTIHVSSITQLGPQRGG